MIDSNLLAIAIPTYKRPELLKKCLESVIKSAQPHNIKIYVYDDSTSDINFPIYEWAKSSYSHIKVTKNPKNLGIDENIAQCIEKSEAEYVWLLGEDDLLQPDAISQILSVLTNNSSPFCFVNYSYISNNYDKILRGKRLDFNSNTEISGKNFFENFIWAAGFIGACVIRKENWLSVDRRKYSGTYFNHVGVISEFIHNSRVKIVSNPLVLNRAEDVASTSWSEHSFDVNFGWDRLLQSLSPIYSKESLISAIDASKEIFWHRSLLFFLSKRADGIYSYSEWKRHVLKSNFSFIFKITSLGFLIIPPTPLNYLKKTARKIKRKLQS